MSLNHIMSSATTGLLTAQTQLRVVSDNIANVNTPGFVRKVATQTPLVSAGLGVGVDIARISLAADRYLERAALVAQGSAAQAGVTADSLDRAQALFGDPSSDNSFFAKLDSLYAAFSSASENAASSVARGATLDHVSDFLSESGRIGASLKALTAEVDSRIAADVERANQLLVDIDKLNGEITRARAVTGDATGSETILTGLVNELSGLMDISVTRRSTGSVVIRASDGTPLAGENGAATLSYVRSEGASGEIAVTQAGAAGQSSLRARLTSGEIKGLLDLRDRELPAIGAQLAEFVSQAVDELNRAHNAAAAVPPPTTMTGRNTGLDLPTALAGFTGATTLAVVSPNGMLQRRIDIDFSAGTMSVDGGAASAFTQASFLADLNTALGGFGSASFSNGALSLSATGGNGLAFSEGASASAKTGRTFSHFFGLNDLVTSDVFSRFETGLRATDPHGFTAGDTVTFRLAGSDGARIKDITIPVPAGGTMQDLLNALNAPSGGVGLYGQFSLGAQGEMTFAPNTAAGAGLTVIADETERGVGGPTLTELFGIGIGPRSQRAERFTLRGDIGGDPMKLAMATLDLSQATAGRPVLSAADGRGGLLLAGAGEVATRFGAVGGLGATAMTVNRYAAELAGSIGRRADAAIGRRETAEAVAAEAQGRRASVEGVNLDEELVAMTTYQQAFNASARVIQASKDMYDTLLGMMG